VNETATIDKKSKHCSLNQKYTRVTRIAKITSYLIFHKCKTL